MIDTRGIPWFIKLQKEYEARGLVVIGISMDDDGWKSVRPWLNEKKVNYPIVIGNEGLGKQYGLVGVTVDYEGIAGKAVREMSAHDLQRFLVVCALVSDLYCPGYNPSHP